MQEVKAKISGFWSESDIAEKKKHCIYFGDKLSLSQKFKFRKTLTLAEGEELWFHGGGKGYKSGFAFTNYGLHFLTFQDGFFSPMLMFPKGDSGFVNYDDLRSLHIADSDRCYGSNYYGHNLIVNGEYQGLVRMSNGITFDEPAIKFCNQLFAGLVGICLESGPDVDAFPDTLI